MRPPAGLHELAGTVERLQCVHRDQALPSVNASRIGSRNPVQSLSGAESEQDEIARRTAFKDRLGLTLSYDLKDVFAGSVPFEDLPAAAAAHWGSQSNEQAQLALCLPLTAAPVSQGAGAFLLSRGTSRQEIPRQIPGSGSVSERPRSGPSDFPIAAVQYRVSGVGRMTPVLHTPNHCSDGNEIRD